MRRVLVVMLVLTATLLVFRAVQPAFDALNEALGRQVAEPEHPDLLPAGWPEGDWAEVKRLGGTWQFRLGDDPAWKDGSGDAGWEPVPVPGPWEDAGYWGYDGRAWYRRAFTLTASEAARLAAAPAFLYLGRVDDVDEVWVNGVFVGGRGRGPEAAGAMGIPPETAYFEQRFYRVPDGVLRADGPNTVAVRVWDAELAGGLLDGVPALVVAAGPSALAPPWTADLAGRWRFHPGDDPAWADPDLDDAGWGAITVPGRWESQGHARLDGFAWYRTTFSVKDAEAGRHVLLLGYIDDLDEVFLDGVRIGGTGAIAREYVRGDEWERLRAYPIPERLLQARTEHTLAVRVYDGLYEGGIYRGPIGVLREEDFRRFFR